MKKITKKNQVSNSKEKKSKKNINNTSAVQEDVLKELEYLLQCASAECGW